MQQFYLPQQQQSPQINAKSPQQSNQHSVFSPLLSKQNIAMLSRESCQQLPIDTDKHDQIFSKSSIITFNSRDSYYHYPSALRLQKSGSQGHFQNQLISPIPIKNPLYAKQHSLLAQSQQVENMSSQCDFSDAQTEYSLNLSPQHIYEIERLRLEGNNNPEPGIDIFSMAEETEDQESLDDEIYRMMEQFQDNVQSSC